MAVALKGNTYVRDYLLKERLGIGSYGVVFKVLRKGDKQPYVLKQISLLNLNKNQIEEVKNESKILSSLNSLYIVKYHESFIENSSLNIVMEYCDGGDLSHYLVSRAGRILAEDKIWNIFIQICCGLAYIHNKKILHRDLKTLNIFLTKDDKVKIGDLGVAKVLNQTNFAVTFIGTPYYLSPEICEEKPYNDKSDVWALGCILYEMATFKHPFNASNQGALVLKILKGKYEPIAKDFSSDLKKMVDLLLDKNHFKRPSITDIIRNQIFLSRAKSLNLIDTVLATANELSFTIDLIKEQNFEKKSIISSEKKRQSDTPSKIKLELVSNSGKDDRQDPTRRLIAMNIPPNFKKQIQSKREKQNLVIKQRDIVKGIINSSNISNMIQKEPVKKVPVKLVKKEETPVKKESGSNFNVNNVNINGNFLSKEKDKQKIKDLNQKIHEFDLKLNILSENKRPFTPGEFNSKLRIPKKNVSIHKECVVDKIVAHKNIKLDNPEITGVEKTQMIIPKENISFNDKLKSTEAFLSDNKNCTNFFKEVLKEDDYKNILINYDKYDINHFVNDINKKSNMKRVSIMSDFMSKKESQIVDSPDLFKITPIESEVVPLCNEYRDESLNFQVYESSLDNFCISEKNLEREDSNNLDYFESTVINTEVNTDTHPDSNKLKSATDESFEEGPFISDDAQEVHSSEEVEVVEDVSLVKKEEIPKSTQEEEYKELLNYKEKFENKISFYKTESMKSSGDRDFNIIFQYYLDISENQGEIDELSEKIEKKIKEVIPKNYFEFIQNFYNLIYYEIQLDNVKKEIESKKP